MHEEWSVVLQIILSAHSLPPSLAKSYSYGKQSHTDLIDDDESGAVGYSYYSTPHEDGDSPEISSSDKEEESEISEESETEQLQEPLENCTVEESLATETQSSS